jgi:hypothetical protein
MGAPQGAQTSGHDEPADELTGMLDGYLHLIPPRVNPLAERGNNIRPERMHTIGENEHQAADADELTPPLVWIAQPPEHDEGDNGGSERNSQDVGWLGQL